MLSVKNMSGGGGGKVIVLPDNPIIELKPNDKQIDVTWEAPSGSIKQYNVYYSTTEPTSIKNMTKKTTTTNTSYTITGLTNGTTYWVVVTSVDTEGYENASVSNMKSIIPQPSMVIAVRDSSVYSYYLIPGSTSWVALPNSPERLAGKPTVYGDGKFLTFTDGSSQGRINSLDSNTKVWEGDIGRVDISSQPNHIAYGNKRWFCPTTSTSYSGKYSVNNGRTWIAITSSKYDKITSVINGIFYGNKEFVVFGGNRQSSDEFNIEILKDDEYSAVPYNSTGTATGVSISAVYWDGEYYYLVSDYGTDSQGYNGEHVCYKQTIDSGNFMYGNQAYPFRGSIQLQHFKLFRMFKNNIVTKGGAYSQYLFSKSPDRVRVSDAVAWVGNVLPDAMSSMCKWGDKLVCVNSKGKSWYSTDGVNWSELSGLATVSSGSTYYGLASSDMY